MLLITSTFGTMGLLLHGRWTAENRSSKSLKLQIADITTTNQALVGVSQEDHLSGSQQGGRDEIVRLEIIKKVFEWQASLSGFFHLTF